jgi:cytoskeletal protein CcmA (bactofilin family)
MDTQHAVADTAPVEANADGVESRRDGANKITLGPGDYLEGKLTYNGHVSVQGQGQAQGEFRITGNFEVGSGGTVKALIEGTNVTIRGDVEGMLTAREKLTLGKSAKLSGDVTVKRLQIDDGASFNGHVRMGNFEQSSGS